MGFKAMNLIIPQLIMCAARTHKNVGTLRIICP